ncbi:hypothetical protein OHA25_18240 [Nonomuraea sp. NBC_00507]|uniref:hypothetical protein n=1 Tax=unclassified Nonomuraea TaxID=2593643 RepID=UPI00273B9047|nr:MULTISPECIES: hypothetical protein [unclassified Nonomuraea]MDP4507414.1 hypothetical protein [Nonomuraea sp. G32]
MGLALLGVGLVVGVLLALADPVLLSRINGEPAEGGRGRFVKADPYESLVRLAPRSSGEERHEPKAA